MSYKLAVLSDNPLGFWEFNGSNIDATSASNHAVVTSASYITPPIIANTGSALRITNSGSVAIYNTAGKYETMSQYFEKEPFTIALWFSFNNELKGNGAGTTVYGSNQLNILKIMSGATQIGKIYYDYSSNTIRFLINGTGNSEAYYVVNDFDKQMYIVATYNEKTLNLSVNLEPGIKGNISDTSIMTAISKTTLSFVIDGTSLSGTAATFLVNSLAVFNYSLRQNQIMQHMTWAGNNQKPFFQSFTSASTSFFNFVHLPTDYAMGDTISGLKFGKSGVLTNLSAEKNGLSPVKIPNGLLNITANASATYSISSSSGISILNNGGIDLNGITQYLNISDNLTISAQVTRSTLVRDFIFGINDVSGNYLYLETASYGSPASISYTLGLYNSFTTTTSSLVTMNAGAYSPEETKIAAKFTNETIYLYASGANVNASVSLSTSASPEFFPLTFSSRSVLTVGNSYHDPQVSNAKIKNFGITTNSFTNFAPSNFDFTTASTFMLKFTDSSNPFKITQHGMWRYTIPSMTYPNDAIVGTYFDWNGMDGAKVFLSQDNGSTYTQIQRNQPYSAYDLSQNSKNILVKVEIDSDYTRQDSNQGFNNFTYFFYNILDKTADGSPYTFSSSGDKTLNNYIYAISDNIMGRQKNFGVRFFGDSSRRAGYAKINVPSSSSYSAIEFWYRPDAIYSASNFIINNQSASSASPAIWVDSSSVIHSSGGRLFINGASYVDGTYKVTVNQPYHIVMVLNAAETSNLYFNGYNWNNSASTSFATYGYLQFWNNTPLDTDISFKYNSYIGQNTLSYGDTSRVKYYSTACATKVSTFNLG